MDRKVNRPLWQRLIRNLTFWVLLAITLGGLLGYLSPELAVQMKPLGDSFIQLVKLFIYPLIFLTITLGISAMGDLKKVGRIGGKAILYFEIVTTFALLIGILVAHILQPGAGVVPREGDVSRYVKRSEEFSWIGFLLENLALPVLLLSIFIGIGLSLYPHKRRVIEFLTWASYLVFRGLRWVMVLAPIGAFGGMAFTIGKFGPDVVVALAKLMVCVYCTMALFIFVVLWLILRWYQVNLIQYLFYIRDELLIVLGTSSSESALPTLMAKLERMGCAKSVVGLVVPAGYSFNLDGTTIYLSMATIFLTQVYGVTLTWSQIFTVIGVLMLTSKGAAGVTGSGFVVLASTMAAVQVVPIEGLALLLGVDRFMSEARSITNLIGNGVACIFLANQEGEFDREKMHAAFTAASRE